MEHTNQNTDLRPLPGHPDAEAVVIGAAMAFPDQVRRLVNELSPDEFQTGQHQQIWRVIRDLAERREEVSLVLVAEELRYRCLVSATDMSYLHKLVSAAAMAETHGLDGCVRMIREAALSRRLLLCTAKISSLCWTEPPQDVLAEARTLLRQAEEQGPENGVSGLSHCAQTLADAGGLDGLFSPAAQGVPTPWEDLNHLTLGMHAGQMIVLAGRTGRGKSAAMAQIAAHAALRHAGAVAIFSLEMQADSILSRMACILAGVDASAVRHGLISREDRTRLAESMAQLNGCPLFLSDRMRVTIPSMYRALQQLAARQPLALVCVDYLQLMSSGTRAENRQQEIAAISRSLKEMAVEFEVPVLVLCQYNREADRGERPALHHIRESGAIGHDADTAWLLHEPEGTEGVEGWLTELIVEKQREGATRTVRLWFERKKTRFQSTDPCAYTA